MKNTKTLIIVCLTLFITVIGCSDFYNWLAEDLDHMEEGEDETTVGTKIYFEDKEEYIDLYKDTEIEKRNTYGNKAYFEDEKQYIDPYKDTEIEKRDAYGNKTYYEN